MPALRTLVSRLSLTAFILGMMGLLPLVGILPSLFALGVWGRIRTRHGDEWNPAADYLDWGLRLAVIGLAASTLLIMALVVVAGWP